MLAKIGPPAAPRCRLHRRSPHAAALRPGPAARPRL